VAAPAPVVTPDDALDEMLAFQNSLRSMKSATLYKTLQEIGIHPSTARQQVRRAMLLAALHAGGDLARAQALMETLAQSQANDRDTRSLKPLAQMLAALYADARRQDDNIDKLNQQLRDGQRRAEQQNDKLEQLNDKLEALKNIERSLSVRPASTPPALPAAK
jgi:uncharacterized coiled-coil protein SlyX